MLIRREAWADKRKRCAEWHLWFAWHPASGPDFIAWLEWIERRGVVTCPDGGWDWEYRECGNRRKA
jgi:hypothetical protein